MNTPGKPDLDRLVTALTAGGRPDELTGREAAAAAFRAGGKGEGARLPPAVKVLTPSPGAYRARGP